MMRLRLLAGALAVAVTAGCNDPIRAEDQIEVIVGASQTIVAPTDTVVLAAALYNASSSTLPIGRPCGRPFQFEILDPHGAVVLDSNGPDFGCATDTTTSPLPLGSGRTLNANLGLIGLKSDGTPLAAGAYLLRATVIIAGTPRRSPTVQILVPAAGTT
jgi:hypothetical protein